VKYRMSKVLIAYHGFIIPKNNNFKKPKQKKKSELCAGIYLS
jgi:hypothetical protein